MIKKNTNLSHFNKEEVPNAKGLTFGIVVSEWNGNITEGLYKGASEALIECGANANDITRIDVPGSYELVFGAKVAAKVSPDAIICLGSVIQGETKHFDFVCEGVTQGIVDLNIKHDVPVIFCVLTDDTKQQSIDRSGGKLGNKGIECAVAAIKMAAIKNIDRKSDSIGF